MERFVYKPVNYIEGEQPFDVIFLAGPIQGAPDWQNEAIQMIHNLKPEVVIASPRREYLPEEFNYEEQVDWETAHLKKAGENGVILFWLAKEKDAINGRSYAQTTRAELFEWKVRHEIEGAKLVVGIEEGFSGEKYIRRRFSQDCPDVIIVNSLESACTNAIQLLRMSPAN